MMKKEKEKIQPCSQNKVQRERDHTIRSTYYHITPSHTHARLDQIV
jgi:hypothetical protein